MTAEPCVCLRVNFAAARILKGIQEQSSDPEEDLIPRAATRRFALGYFRRYLW